MVAAAEISIVPVTDDAGRKEFVDYGYRVNSTDPNFVPQLRSDELEKFTPGKNPFFEHARAQLYFAKREGRIVGRISAHIDDLALIQPADKGFGPGTGNWGALEADDEDIAKKLIATAEDWLRQQGMTRVVAPMNLSVWEEPGLLVLGHDHPPTVMMAHHPAKFQPWVEGAGYDLVKKLYTYDLGITTDFPPLIQRIVASGEKNPRIRIREVDLKKFDEEAALIVELLNEAWSDNWGFVSFTDSEVAYMAKHLKPLVRSDLIRIAELDGEPVAFMMTLPDANEIFRKVNGRTGKPSILGWIKLALWLRKPKTRTMRVPLMGVRKRLQASRLASQLAFMMIEYIRRDAIVRYGSTRGEIGWVLDDNQGMNAIAEAIESKINKQYNVYAKTL